MPVYATLSPGAALTSELARVTTAPTRSYTVRLWKPRAVTYHQRLLSIRPAIEYRP
jgi:hypothetical protein